MGKNALCCLEMMNGIWLFSDAYGRCDEGGYTFHLGQAGSLTFPMLQEACVYRGYVGQRRLLTA